MNRSRFVLLTFAAGLMSTAAAQEDEPDLSFLEYLGSWQEGDEDWLVVAAEAGEDLDKDEASAKDEEANETSETHEADESDEN